jgi:hypothetical protein
MRTCFFINCVCVLLLACGLTGCDKELKMDAALTDIYVDRESVAMVIDDRLSVIAYPVPWDAGDIDFQWSSANTAVATVNNAGQIIAAGAGQTTVTVSQGGISKAVSVNVRDLTLAELRVGAWLFEDADNIGKATVGNPLVAYKMDGNKTLGSPSEEGFTVVDGPVAGKKAVRVPKQSYFKCTHGIAPNGGGTNVNQYTLLIDFRLPDLNRCCFFQTDMTNQNDVDFFMRANGYDFGIVGQYADIRETPFGTIEGARWYRLVISVNLGGTTRYFLDGILIGEKTPGLDSNASFSKDGVLLFADEDGEDEIIDVAEVVIWDKPLNNAQAASLGEAGKVIE